MTIKFHFEPRSLCAYWSLSHFFCCSQTQAGSFKILGRRGQSLLEKIDSSRSLRSWRQSSHLLFGFIALVNRSTPGAHCRAKSKAHASPCIEVDDFVRGFLYIAFDEAFQIHEKLIWPFQRLIGEDNLGIFYFAWVIPAIFIVIMLGLFFLKFLLYLSVTERNRFLLAAALYLGGAIGMELIGGRHVELYGEENWGYSTITTLEESLEMAGLIFFIWALLKYCEAHYSSVQFHFKA